jgi:tRNA dimethylallyltransferase
MTASVPALRAICLTGPTGCGKTELALALVERWPLDIVSMDSAMVYRGMDIGTAKPSRAILARLPHRLIDILEPEDAYSAGRFRGDALRAIAEIRDRGRWPLLVGGTLLYLRALREGLAELPPRDERIRGEIDAQAKAGGWSALHARLREIDPEAAARIEPGDRQRIQRALEVHALTGRPLTELQRRQRAGGRETVEIATLAVVPEDRVALAAQVERRFDAMVAAGFLEEVRGLRCRPGLSAAHASMRSVGYRQLWAHLAGEYGWQEARRKAVVATRQLAKRQMTWLRSDPAQQALPAFGADVARRLDAHVARQLSAWSRFT